MKYEIIGTPLPVVECTLEAGESIVCEEGAMSWMSSNLKMETSGGSAGEMLDRAMTSEKIFKETYTAENEGGVIAFSSCYPGSIVAVEISEGKEIICQKGAFLAATPGVDFSIFFQKNVGAGLFGGEGFIMQKLSGEGTAFLEIDGAIVEKTLGEGESLTVDNGYLAMMDSTCTIDLVAVKGVKNIVFGGEGFFNAVLTGPGKITLQTMPESQMIRSMVPNIPLPRV